MSFPVYDIYQDSGVEWLGKVPNNWRLKRLKYAATLRTDKADERDNAVGLENIEGWTGRFIPTESEFEGAGVDFRAGDVLFGKLRPYLAKVWLANFDGEAVGDFHVMRPAGDVCGRYLVYQMLTRDFISIVDGSTFGAKMPRASWDFMANMVVPVPTLDEQRAIASFLDVETSKIDGLVSEQRRLIELLKEKRQAVISHAVTKGLNPNAPMKPSGIQWLGEVPEHWSVVTVRRVLAAIEQGWSPQCDSRPASEGEWGVLKTGCVNRGVFCEIENKALPDDLEPIIEYEVKAGDVLMSRASGSPELVGATAFVYEVRRHLMLSDKTFRIHLAETMEPRFFVALFNSQLMRSQIEQSISGAEGLANNLPQSKLRCFVLALPPVTEQRRIVQELRLRCEQFDSLVAEAERAIELLQERRIALISAAVTGKIDLRNS